MPDIATMATGAILGLTGGAINNQMQGAQNERMLRQQFKYNKKMSQYNNEMALDLWNKTNYGAQKEHMKAAGLNPALMYGMGGGGGATASATPGNVNATSPQQNDVMGMMSQAAQLELLKAQKENIQADTENKKADTVVKDQTQFGLGLDNALKEYLQQTDIEGKDVFKETGKGMEGSIATEKEKQSLRQQQAETKFKLDENDRQNLMNSAVMQEIGAKISLMAKQGQTQEQIYKNLAKEGMLLDAEIEWNKLDIEGGNVGKFLTNIIKMALKPR